MKRVRLGREEKERTFLEEEEGRAFEVEDMCW